MTRRCWNIGKLGWVNMFHIVELSHGLVDDSLLIVACLWDSTRALTMIDDLTRWSLCTIRSPCCGSRLIMLLEVETRRCILLWLACDDSWSTIWRVRQMPLIWASIVGVFRAAFHMQRVLSYQLDIAGLMALMLRLISWRHNSVDIMGLFMSTSLMTGCLLVSCDSPSDTEVALHTDLLTCARCVIVSSACCLVVSTELSSTVQAGWMLGCRILSNLLTRCPSSGALVTVTTSRGTVAWSHNICAKTTVSYTSLVREWPVEILGLSIGSAILATDWQSFLAKILGLTFMIWFTLCWTRLKQVIRFGDILEGRVESWTLITAVALLILTNSIASSNAMAITNFSVDRRYYVALRNHDGLSSHRWCLISGWTRLHNFLKMRW